MPNDSSSIIIITVLKCVSLKQNVVKKSDAWNKQIIHEQDLGDNERGCLYVNMEQLERESRFVGRCHMKMGTP